MYLAIFWREGWHMEWVSSLTIRKKKKNCQKETAYSRTPNAYLSTMIDSIYVVMSWIPRLTVADCVSLCLWVTLLIIGRHLRSSYRSLRRKLGIICGCLAALVCRKYGTAPCSTPTVCTACSSTVCIFCPRAQVYAAMLFALWSWLPWLDGHSVCTAICQLYHSASVQVFTKY